MTMKLDAFSAGMRLEEVDLDALIASSDISEKRRGRLRGLKSKWASGDRVLYYCSERKEWDAGMGSEGYALVRNDEVIDGLVLRMN